MKIGDKVNTPRFCTVRIDEVFDSPRDARAGGYTEPTYYEGAESAEYDVRGKSEGMYHMTFAAVKRRS